MGDPAICGECGRRLCACPEGPLECPAEDRVLFGPLPEEAGCFVFPCQRCGGCDGNCRGEEVYGEEG